MATTRTRAELHALVWQRPLLHLARELGLCDVALHKLCRRHQEPTPPAGHWAKVAHGKAVTAIPLPEPERGEVRVTIAAGAAPSETPPVDGFRCTSSNGGSRPRPCSRIGTALTRRCRLGAR